MSYSMEQSSHDDHEYQEQLNVYHASLLPDFEYKEEMNLRRRLNKIEEIVNNKSCRLSSYFIRFQITSKLFNKMLTLIKPEISRHTKVQSAKCEKRILNQNEYKKPARNMLSRWKPAILANHVLHRIIFITLYNHCYTICRLNKKDDTEILKLFVTIFGSILSETVKFPQTKPQPLIFHAIFHRNNQFKKACAKFLRHFKVIQFWNHTAKKAEIRFNSFKKCLKEINFAHITNAIIPIMLDEMNINPYNQACCIHYKHVTKRYIIGLEMEYKMNEYDKISNKQIFDSISIIDHIVEYYCYGMEFFTINAVQQPNSYNQITQKSQNYSWPKAIDQPRNYIDFSRKSSNSRSDNPKNKIVHYANNLCLQLQHRHSETCVYTNNKCNQPTIQQSQSNCIDNRNMCGICPMAPIYQQSVPIDCVLGNNRSMQQSPIQSTIYNPQAHVLLMQPNNYMHANPCYYQSQNTVDNAGNVCNQEWYNHRSQSKDILMNVDDDDEPRDADGDIILMPYINDRNNNDCV